jgi:hypothetical protein
MQLHRFRPRLLDALKGYDGAQFARDLGAGLTVGIVAATVDGLKFAGSTNALPQNVNFAVKSSVAIDFLETHGALVETGASTQHLASEDVADRAAGISVHIVCN